MTGLEPSSDSYLWNVIRCTCIIALLFVPADILGVMLYNVFYGADFALFCMSLFCAIILSIVGGFWFAYIDLKYARMMKHYEEVCSKNE